MRGRPWRALDFTVGIALLVGLNGCGAQGSSRPAAPAPPPAFELEMSEYAYRPPAGTVPSGRVNFDLRNRGDQGHQPTLLLLPEDVPPITEQLKGEARRNVSVVAGNAGIPAGVTGALAVDLEPGRRYALVCFAKTADSKDHSRLGMAWEFRAGAEKSSAP